jgi:ketosteroid isomerase-like protein
LTKGGSSSQNLSALFTKGPQLSTEKEERAMANSRVAKKTKAAVRKPAKAVKKPARRVQRMSRTAAPRAAAQAAMNDYEGARRVLSRYCYALDSGRLEDLGPLFHPEAVFSVSFENGQKHSGRDTIQAWYQRFFQHRPDAYRYMRHKIYEPLMTVTGDTATSSTYFDADSVDADGSIRVVAGRYDDVLVKEQGQWFFKERAITAFYRYSPGQCQEGM